MGIDEDIENNGDMEFQYSDAGVGRRCPNIGTWGYGRYFDDSMLSTHSKLRGYCHVTKGPALSILYGLTNSKIHTVELLE